MLRKKYVAWVTVIVASFSINHAFAEYIEGIDTTDADGYGLDSAFQIYHSQMNTYYHVVKTEKSLQVIFYTDGYFHYSFDDMKMAPLPVKPNGPSLSLIDFCVIVQTRDSIYSKIKVLQVTEDNRFIFRWGTNATPGNRYLVAEDYDRAVCYKPNNFHSLVTCEYKEYYRGQRCIFTMSWEPPLQNDNHLTGYIYYLSKRGVAIDTTAPIDLSQWDSTVVGDSIYEISSEYDEWPSLQYYNIVAVYREGRSDFLEGWTCYHMPPVSIATPSKRPYEYSYQIEVENGIHTSGPVNASFSVYNILGRRLTCLPEVPSCNTPGYSATGVYIIQSEVPFKTFKTQSFTNFR